MVVVNLTSQPHFYIGVVVSLAGHPRFFVDIIISLAIDKAISMGREVAVGFSQLSLW